MGTLRVKIQFLFALLILSMGVLVVAWFALLADQSVDDRIRQDVEGATRVLGSLIGERKEILLEKARVASEKLSLQRSLGHRATLKREVERGWRATRTDGLALLDANGAILSQAGLKGKLDPRIAKVVANGSSKGKSWSGVTTFNGKLVILASSPMSATRPPNGAVVAMTLVDSDLAKRLRDAAGTDIVFVRNGKTVSASLETKAQLPTKEGKPTTLRIGSQPFVAEYKAFPGTWTDDALGFVALREIESVVAPLRSLGIMFVTGLLGALAAAIALTGAFSRSLTRPLDALLSAAGAVRDGRWPEPLPVKSRDEIGTLQIAFNDMTASLQSSHLRLLAMIDTDPLTELDNHRRFKERLDQEVFRSSMAGKPLALLLLDFDQFGDYNQQFGHGAGDEALKSFAALLRDNAPDVAFLARYGGEEFAVLLPMNSLASAEALAIRIRAAGQDKFLGPLTVSVGLAELGPGISSGAGLLLSAELALSRAKQLGKDRICSFDAVPGAADQHDPFQLQRYLVDSTFAAIQALAGAVDAKDPYTQGHSLRVAKFASDLARYVGESPAMVDLVYRTGTLHDVGKIGVPDSVLTKPSRLDPEELAIMETHPVLGELIVKRAPQLDDMLPGVRHHHERWDGRGYPDRLMSDQIPRLACFISIADTFDAMTSDRPYRKALADEVALDEIQRNAGHQFEPNLALAFVRMMRLHGRLSEAA